MHTDIETSFATVAEYFQFGISMGIIKCTEVSDWATALIGRLEQPPYEVIQVAWSKDAPDVWDGLSAITGKRDKVLAAHWAMATLARHDVSTEHSLRSVVDLALQMLCAADMYLSDNYEALSQIEHNLELSEFGMYNDIDACRDALRVVLARYPAAPV